MLNINMNVAPNPDVSTRKPIDAQLEDGNTSEVHFIS